MLFGAHCSTSGGPHMALLRAAQIGADSCQLFVKNNMRWRGTPYRAADLELWRKTRGETKIPAVFGHTGYLINIAGPESPIRDRSIASLIQELELAASLGLPFLVLHPGAHLGAGESVGLAQAVRALDEVASATRRFKVRIALENTAGQGTCLGGRFEHLAAIMQGVKNPQRLGICIDTAHLFAAGYDFRSRDGWRSTVSDIDRLVGIENVLAFHLNDSKTGLGSHVDRHAHIGKGRIGRQGFSQIVNDSRFRGLPACIETPKSSDLHEDIDNLRVLRSLARKALKKRA